jgi:hypothetical protein
MNQTTKIILALTVGLTACCCAALAFVSIAGPLLVGSALGRSFTEDQAQAAAVGAKIADYTLPSGYNEAFAMDVFGTRMVGIAPASFNMNDGNPTMLIVMMQFSSVWADEEMMRQQIMETTGQGGAQLTVIETEIRTVRGQEVEFTISEGHTAEGIPSRQMTGLFEGKGGPAMLTIIGIPEMWNQETADAFIDSLR